MPEEAGVPAAVRDQGAAARGVPTVLSLRVRDVQLYYLGECLTELLIYAMVIFSPWAFGTTQEWLMRTMNAGGYTLGALLAIKLGIRWLKGYRPARWDDLPRGWGHSHHEGQARRGRAPLVVLAGLTVAIVAYCWVSAWNARCYIDPDTFLPSYRDNYVKWLPYSLDGNASWAAFRNYLALACSFWAILDWLPGKTSSEERAESPAPGRHRRGSGSAPLFPGRLRRLLWVLAINGGLLAVEGIVQRLDQCPLLLFLVRPRYGVSALSQFGPYAYRSNAGQYFSLLWPVCVGFWWTLNRRSVRGHAGHHLVLICALGMAACPIIATTRAGTVVAAGTLVLGPLCLLAIQWWDGVRRRGPGRAATSALLLFSLLALALGFGLGWKTLKLRFERIDEDYKDREAMYDTARPMAADYPLFGTGRGPSEPSTRSTASRKTRPRSGTHNCTMTGWRRASPSGTWAACSSRWPF